MPAGIRSTIAILLPSRLALDMLLSHLVVGGEDEDKYFRSRYPAPTVQDVGGYQFQYAFLDGGRQTRSVLTGDTWTVNRRFFRQNRNLRRQFVNQTALQKQLASLSEACDRERLFTRAREFLNRTLWKDFGPDVCSSLSDHWLTNVLHGDLISGDTMFLRSLFMFL